MSSDKKILKEQYSKILDPDTGEVIEETTYKTSRIDGEPDFIKLYIADIIKLKNLPNGCNMVLFELLKCMNYKNLIVLNMFIKSSIAKELGIGVNTVEHHISRMVSQGILSRIANGTYFVNPDLFGRGKWQDIRALRLSIKYDQNGRTFHLDRDTQLELTGNGFDE